MFHAAFARTLLVGLLAGGAASPALAQHVVTDSEAGKLTLDALTATPAPIFHRAVYRPSRFAYARQSNVAYRQSVHAVRTVAWHPATRSAAFAHPTAHRKTRRG